jgi:hypothetical protein
MHISLTKYVDGVFYVKYKINFKILFTSINVSAQTHAQ